VRRLRRAHEEKPGNAAARAKQAEVQRAADVEAEPRLIELQRSSGNAAVAQMVQRDRAASTDAPGAKKRKKAPPKKAAEHKMISGRVIAYSIKDGKTYITIGLGSDRGIVKGLQGRLVRASGTLIVSFEVDAVNGATRAYVEATPDGVKEADHAEIDLGSAPESQEGKEF
jgi:hypothetical protein